MRSRPTSSLPLVSLSHKSDGNHDGQEVPQYSDGDNCDVEEDEESPRGANKQKEEDEMATTMLGKNASAAECSPPTIAEQIEEMFLN